MCGNGGGTRPPSRFRHAPIEIWAISPREKWCGQKNTSTVGEDLFFCQSPVFGRKKLLNFWFIPEKAFEFQQRPFFVDHLIFTEKSPQSNSRLMKIWVKFVYGWIKLPKRPPLCKILATRLIFTKVQSKAAKASPHAKFYNLSTDYSQCKTSWMLRMTSQSLRIPPFCYTQLFYLFAIQLFASNWGAQ